MSEEIDFGPLLRATERLSEAIAERQRLPENDFVRDSVVQRFEFTYELAGAMLRRFLVRYGVRASAAREATFPALIRMGNEHGLLLHDWTRWSDYRDARNTTSHAYDEKRAKMAVDLAPALLEDVEYLYRRMMQEQP